jgi:hypothetical protein
MAAWNTFKRSDEAMGREVYRLCVFEYATGQHESERVPTAFGARGFRMGAPCLDSTPCNCRLGKLTATLTRSYASRDTKELVDRRDAGIHY